MPQSELEPLVALADEMRLHDLLGTTAGADWSVTSPVSDKHQAT
jgi:hypothetical protein